MRTIRTLISALALAGLPASAGAGLRGQDGGAAFEARSARSGRWSDASTWEGRRAPRAGDRVQVRAGHAVVYDAASGEALRMVHVAGRLSFARDRSTRLDVGLLKIQAGEQASEDGFDCDAHFADAADRAAGLPEAVLEIGTPEEPIPAGVTALIRLVYFDGMNRETLPAIVNCGGRWEVHGAPMRRTWVKLGAPARAGDRSVTLLEPIEGWKEGDRVIITAGKKSEVSSFRRRGDEPPRGNTEERFITAVAGTAITLDRPLEKPHHGSGETRSEIANLSRNVVIESADPGGSRGHTMYHRRSSGGISYAEFRHLGKEGVLGKYPIHFHMVRDSMRGSSVIGASIWDSHNRWLTIHGTDYLVVRDCVGYRSVGHGFFLEDATEEYNVLDGNLAVQATAGKRLPQQVLPFDPNDGAGFWWANGRNTLIRNVACENDEYGYRFDIQKRSNFDPELRVRLPDGRLERRDVRALPFFRFQDNESHSEGLYSFNLGEDANPSVRGDRRHPFIARDLRAWETHYALRPNLQFFLMEGLDVDAAAYGVYHPDYDSHVYRGIHLRRITAEPVNRGHDDESIQYGTFTYDDLTIEDSRIGRDPLIQLACTSPRPGRAGHFRNLTIRNSDSRQAKVVDLGGGPRNGKLENPVAYFFHDYPVAGKITEVMSARFEEVIRDGAFTGIEGFTGKDVRAAQVKGIEFPQILDPVDDLPPATIITSIRRRGGLLLVRGLSHDNGEVEAVEVNGRPAAIFARHAGVADWEIALDGAAAQGDTVTARARDRAGNEERMPHAAAIRAIRGRSGRF